MEGVLYADQPGDIICGNKYLTCGGLWFVPTSQISEKGLF